MARSLSLTAALLALALPAAAHASCGAAFCSINTNWDVQSAWTEPGTRIDLRYEFIDQDQPRHHTGDVAVGEIPRHHDEVETINHNLFAMVDHTFDRNWGVSVSMPIVMRDHDHIHNHQGGQIPESWDFTKLGDMRVLGRYQFPIEQNTPEIIPGFGLNFGLKLPTGSFEVDNDEGSVAERSLQPGTGTVDALLGAYYQQTLVDYRSSWFAQILYQQPLHKRDEFRPGWQVSFDLGYRYEATDKLGLLLQLNTLLKGRDRGEQAEPGDSGSRTVSLSPGLSYAVLDNVQVYGFVQKPIYQWVRGVQLTADWAGVIGVSTRF